MGALKELHERYIGNDPERNRKFEIEMRNADIAQKIYDLRTGYGLSQADFGDAVGLTAKEINDLENADYAGDALPMYRWIQNAYPEDPMET